MSRGLCEQLTQILMIYSPCDSGARAALSEEQQSCLEAVFSFVEGMATPKFIRVSKVGSTAWEKIQRKAGLTVSPYSGNFEAPKLEPPPKFGWDDRLERAQAERYMPYLNTCLPFNKRAYQLVDAANKHPNMLSVSSLADKLGYEILCTTDVAIVLRRAAQINQPANGLRIVFELKKKGQQQSLPGYDHAAVV